MTARISIYHVLERAIIAEAFDAVCQIQYGVVLIQGRMELIPKHNPKQQLLCLIFRVFGFFYPFFRSSRAGLWVNSTWVALRSFAGSHAHHLTHFSALPRGINGAQSVT